MPTVTHRHGPTAPVVIRTRNDVAHDPTPSRAQASELQGTRPDRPENGPRRTMNNLNSILLEGNLSRDPELRYTPSAGTSPGTPVCTLVVASARTYKLAGERVEEVSFVEAVTTGKLATVCAEHLVKGRGVRLVGRIKQERWEDADGNSRSKVLIVCEHVEFQPRRAPAPRAATEAVAS